MAEQTVLPGTEKKRKRAPRRNFQKEILELETYCRLSIGILREGPEPMSEYGKGQILAFEKVLSRIGDRNGR